MDDIPELHRAFEIANQADLTPSELEDLERREMFIYDQQGAINLGREEEKRALLETYWLNLMMRRSPQLQD